MPPSDHLDDYDDDGLHDHHSHHGHADHHHPGNHRHHIHDGDASQSSPGLFGTPLQDARHWHGQTGDFTCGIQSQAGILEAITGRNVDELVASVEAAQAGLLTTHGTMPDHIGRWLESHGIECHSNDNGTFLDVIKELRDGNKVIVDVDSHALWHSNDTLQAFHSQSADHAIWLTGVDASDPDHVKIFINDSGRPDGAANVYDLHDLEHVLNHPGFHYVATGHGPSHLPEHPAGYDEQHGVFSGLDHFLHDHGAALTSVAATATLAAIRLRRATAARGRPAAPQQEKQEESATPMLTLPPPLLLLEDMNREDRDRALRSL